MNKKIKNKSLLIVFLVLLCSLFVPYHTVYAYFSDTASEETGIELTLGSIDLDVKENNNPVLTIERGQNNVKLKETIQNKGTLTGKVAYRILSKNTKSNITSILSNYIMLKDISKDSELILNPGETREVSLEVDITSIQDEIENNEIQVEFLLFQTNGTVEKPLFHDEERASYRLEIKDDGFWPSEQVIKTIGDFNYVLELPEYFNYERKRFWDWNWDWLWNWEFNVFNRYHESNNTGILYLESNNSNNWENIIQFSKSDMSVMNVEVFSTNRVKVIFKLNREVNLQDWKLNYYETQTFIHLRGYDGKIYPINIGYKAKEKSVVLSKNTTSFQMKRDSFTANIILERGKDLFDQNNEQESHASEVINSNKENITSQNSLESDRQAFNDKNEKLLQENPKSVLPEMEEETRLEKQKLPKEQIDEPFNQPEQLKESILPTEDQFKYLDLTFNEETYKIGVTQDQFNWLLNFATVQEFSNQLTEDTPILYVKYDQVTGIEDIEQFVYQLAEEKQLNFEVTLKNIPEHKLLEITFTK